VRPMAPGFLQAVLLGLLVWRIDARPACGQTVPPDPSPAETLASALAGAATGAERDALLAAHPELIATPLRQALVARAAERSNAGDPAGALELYRLALKVAEPIADREGMAEALRGIGISHLLMGDYDEALKRFESGLTVADAMGDKSRVAGFLQSIANARMELGQLDAAEAACRRVLTIADVLNDPAIRLRALNALGTVVRKRGDYTAALDAYREALPLAEKIGLEREVRGILHNEGQVLVLQGDARAALERFERSLSLSETVGDKNSMALTLGGIGSAHRTLGDYRQAARSLQRSLTLAEEMQSKPRITEALGNMGILYYLQGNNDLALDHLERAHALAEAMGSQDLMVRLLNNLGAVRRRRGEYDVALEAHHKALVLKEAMGQKDGVASTWGFIGEALSAKGDQAGAREAWEKAIAGHQAVGNMTSVAVNLGNLAALEADQGHWDEALALAERSAAMAREISDLEDLWEARTTAGRCQVALGRGVAARQAFDEAIETIETLRAQAAGGQQEESQAFGRRVRPYQEMVALLARERRGDEALAYAERAKARVLVDALLGRGVPITKGMTPEEQQRERRLAVDLVALNRDLDRQSRAENSDSATLQALRGRLDQARLQRETNQAALYAAHPELQGRRGEAPPGSRSDAATFLPDATSALLEYVVTDDAVHLFVLTHPAEPDLRLFTLGVGRRDLAAQAEDFRGRLARRDPGFRESAARLHEILLGPAAELLRGTTRWIVVPDGPIWELPFQALVGEGGRYVLEDRAVSYAPSIAALREMRRSRGRANPPRDLLVLANPALGAGPSVGETSMYRDGSLGPLPEAEREAAALRRLYGRDRSDALTGPAAREDTLKTNAAQYRILHLATHGIFDDARPVYSHLLLAQPGGAVDPGTKSKAAGAPLEDGLLEAWEIMDFDLEADLAVMSACETARGRPLAGEGLIGLSWAWFVAGVPTTVVSHWKVESKSTTDLMIGLHRGLRAGRAPAEALRASALGVLRKGESSHPFYWAGFIVMGDGF